MLGNCSRKTHSEKRTKVPHEVTAQAHQELDHRAASGEAAADAAEGEGIRLQVVKLHGKARVRAVAPPMGVSEAEARGCL